MSHWHRHEHEHGGRWERGDLRLVILDLLQDHPSYGYEIMRALEERFHGFYTPSAGTIYPTLQWLQDLGYVTVSEQDGRKNYTITDEGRRFLAAGGPRVDEIWARMRGWAGPFDRQEFRDEMREMTRGLRHQARGLSADKLRRIREVVVRASREIEDILREPERGPGANRPGYGGGPGTAPGWGSVSPQAGGAGSGPAGGGPAGGEGSDRPQGGERADRGYDDDTVVHL